MGRVFLSGETEEVSVAWLSAIQSAAAAAGGSSGSCEVPRPSEDARRFPRGRSPSLAMSMEGVPATPPPPPTPPEVVNPRASFCEDSTGPLPRQFSLQLPLEGASQGGSAPPEGAPHPPDPEPLRSAALAALRESGSTRYPPLRIPAALSFEDAPCGTSLTS